MESRFKQFAAIATNWVPKNPVKAFLPFFYYYINAEVSNSIKIESFSKGLERTCGIHFPFHVISSTLAYLRSTGEASLDDKSYWTFNLKPENKKVNSLKYNETTSALLIESFKRFYPDDKEIQTNAEDILNNFFINYDHEIMSYELDYKNEDKFIRYDYFVAKFIEDLEKTNKELFNFVVQIAKGSIVKSTILTDYFDVKFFKDSVYYLDTKIVFFALGYYGDYFKNEYQSFIDVLNSVGVKVTITDYVLNEIISILRSCQRHVDSDTFRYELSFDILRNFRKREYTATMIDEMIVELERDIEKCGINIEFIPDRMPSPETFNENYEKLYESIQNVYGYFERDEFGNEFRAALETDIRSILYAYRKRNDNSITSIRAAKVFFVTTNRALVRATNKYHEALHKKTISPITTDDFIGVLLLSGSENQSMSKIKLLSFCNDCFDLRDKTRADYIEKVNELERNKKITSNEVFLLKNSGLIDDALLHNYEKNNFMVNEQCVYDVLSDIKDTLTNDLHSEYERKIDALNESHSAEIRDLKNVHEQEIEAANKDKNALQNELFALRIKPLKRIFIFYYVLIGLLIVVSIAAFVCGLCINIVENKSALEWIAFVGGAIGTIYFVFELIISIKKHTGPIYSFFKKHYDKKVDLIREETKKEN